MPATSSDRLLPAPGGKLELPEKSEVVVHMGRVTGSSFELGHEKAAGVREPGQVHCVEKSHRCGGGYPQMGCTVDFGAFLPPFPDQGSSSQCCCWSLLHGGAAKTWLEEVI